MDSAIARAVVPGAIAVLSALGVVALLGAPWYEATTQLAPTERPFVAQAAGWKPLTISDIAIATLAAAAALLTFVGVAMRYRGFPLAGAALAAGAAGIVIYRLAEPPGTGGYSPPATMEVRPLWGAWLALACAVAIVICCVAVWVLLDRGGGRKP